jgi:CheY-like chemotaxis protein
MLVAVTGYGDIEAHERAAAAGCDEHFAKPIEPEQLSKLAQRAARRARGAEFFAARA